MARLTPRSRERLIRRHPDERHPLKVLAAEVGISLRTIEVTIALCQAVKRLVSIELENCLDA